MQIVDREQELMSTAGLQSLGGGAGLGRGGLDRQLRIVPSTRAVYSFVHPQLALCGCQAALHPNVTSWTQLLLPPPRDAPRPHCITLLVIVYQSLFPTHLNDAS